LRSKEKKRKLRMREREMSEGGRFIERALGGREGRQEEE
jgi:hypothetical protein